MTKDLEQMSIPELVRHEEATRAQIGVQVMLARGRSESWAAIGVQLGVSPQEAHRRYAHQWKWHAAAEGLPTGE